MHASYAFQNEQLSFDECRTLQAYQATQFIRHVTRPGDAIIFTGDFNHESDELGMVGLRQLISLRDTFDIADKKVNFQNLYSVWINIIGTIFLFISFNNFCNSIS
jgi:hypothetical protein